MAVLFMWIGQAHAERKRVVVLDFEGPNAKKFHSDVIKLVKKGGHSVVKLSKWTKTAEEMDASKVTENNVKKVAKKAKIDAVITGKIEKKRDEYVIKLKLRSGATGELVGKTVSTKSDGPRIEGQASKDIKDDLIALIDDLDKNGGDGGDDEGGGDSGKSKGDDATGDEPKHSGFSRKGGDDGDKKHDDEGDKGDKKHDDEGDKKGDDDTAAALETKKDNEDEDHPKKKHHKSKDTAENDDENGVEEHGDTDTGPVDKTLWLSPSRRAIDVVAGLSFTARNLKFDYTSDLGNPPPGYKQGLPVGGAMLDATFYPMSFNHKKKPDIYSGIGVNLLYDQVPKINSQKSYSDMNNKPQIANLSTAESRWSFGGVFRYPLGKGANAIVVGGTLSYSKEKFTVAQTLPNNDPTDIPNVDYSMISPGAFVRAPLIPKFSFNLDAMFHAITDTGAIQTRTQYGAATVSGYTLILGADYMITPNIFARAAIRYQKIGFSFKGDPMSMTNTRDTDPEQDVRGATDSYFGGLATVGYAY